jgi:1-acyl-sn-glycerol-3-phosphate acyltransferase
MLSMSSFSSAEARERVERLELPFNSYGLDPFGISKEHLAVFYSTLGLFYRHYFRVRTYGIEHVPKQGRAMVIGNHSGGLPVDGGMLLASLFFELDPPRHAHGMVEYFAQNWPFVSSWFSRLGQLPGLPEHALRFLEADRVLMVFPEGARGTGKLYKDRYKLVRFGTGFLRIALQTGTPIVPFAFLGGEEALRTVYHAPAIARVLGAPYVPIPPWLVPMPLPFPCEIHYGEPVVFEGTGNESDSVIEDKVSLVRERIEALIEVGREQRRGRVREAEQR